MKLKSIPASKYIISIINVYAPTSRLVRDDVSVLINFYNDVRTVLDKLKNKLLIFFTGYWNAKIEKRSNNMPVTIVLLVMLVVFQITVGNISSIFTSIDRETKVFILKI